MFYSRSIVVARQLFFYFDFKFSSSVLLIMAASLAIKLATDLGTGILSVARLWIKERLKEKVNSKLEEIVSQNNVNSEEKHEQITATSFDQEYVAQLNEISKTLNDKLDNIQQGIDILRNKDYESAKSWYIQALRWRDNQDKFEEYIKLSYKKCVNAKSTITSSVDKVHLYSLSIACGFIYHSNYGENYMDGLRHIYYELIDMNQDMKIRKDLGSALGSKFYWNKSERTLIESVLYFTIRISVFIKDIQKSSTNKSSLIKYDTEEKKYNDENQKPLKLTFVDLNSLNSVSPSLDDKILINTDWIPCWENGYYFGNIKMKNVIQNGCKYTILGASNFRNIMKINESDEIVPIDDLIITVPSVYACARVVIVNHDFRLDWEPNKSIKNYEVELTREYNELWSKKWTACPFIVKCNLNQFVNRMDIPPPNAMLDIYIQCETY